MTQKTETYSNVNFLTNQKLELQINDMSAFTTDMYGTGFI